MLEFVELVRRIAGRGWSPATGGNFSRVESREPLRLWVTPSGIDKSYLESDDLIRVDESGNALEAGKKPSAETLIHCTIAELWGAETILHTHTVWNTLASLAQEQEFAIEGLEMVKALSGNSTHDMVERVPIVENDQDMNILSAAVRGIHKENPRCHGVLIRGHGLYTWGNSPTEAWRHLEALEFLFEVMLRTRMGRTA